MFYIGCQTYNLNIIGILQGENPFLIFKQYIKLQGQLKLRETSGFFRDDTRTPMKLKEE